MNNINLLNRNECTGCGCCVNICPNKAIKMIENNEGFLEPIIDKKLCINCGLCKKKCPQLNTIQFNETNGVYACYLKNNNDLLKVASGGVFYAIAKNILENNGVVFGSLINDNFEIIHKKVDSLNELDKLKGSKYVQSNLKETFKETKELLNDNRKVLFSGTPCQIAGLKAYLNREYQNLYTIDLICHGVPSPKLFKKYINNLNEKFGKIIEYKFRTKDKNNIENGYTVYFKTDKKEFYRKSSFDPYMNAFQKSINFREVCYNCKYAKTERIGDITVGDFWGLEYTDSKFYNKNGNSVVLINSLKGKELFESIKNSMKFTIENIENAKRNNNNLNKPAKRAELRNNVYKDIDIKKFDIYAKENLKFKVTLKDYIKLLIPQKVKKYFKAIRRRF